MKTTDYFSKKATLVSFIMSIFVIYIHANNLPYYGIAANGKTISNIAVNILGETIGEVAVPFFFMMSAYWLFRFDTHDRNAMNILIRKMKKKVKTICLPYLLWNTFGMVFYMAITRIPFAANMMNNGTVIPITVSNVMEGIFLHKYYFTFWYLQDLIILTVISPILLILLKNKYITLTSIGILGASVLIQVDFELVKGTSFLFFLIGAYIATYSREFFENKRDRTRIWFIIFVLYAFVRYIHAPILAKLVYFVSPILLWKSMDVFFLRSFMKKKTGWFTTQSFFIYASHVIPVTIIGHLLAKFGQNCLWATVSYLIAPWITLGLIYIVAKVLYKYTPNFYGLICGGRI